MKCQFCNQRCSLLKEGDPNFSKAEMTWLCDRHPTRVLHHVRIERFSLRRDHSIHGTTRNWNLTTVSWVNEKGQLLSAHYERFSDGDVSFTIYHIVKSNQGPWADKYNQIFELEGVPKEFTPENIAKKVAALTIFS